MSQFTLDFDQTNELRRAHRQAKDKHVADRIKAVYLLSRGKSAAEVAEVLMLDEDTVRNYRKRYEASGVAGLQTDNYKGTIGFLSVIELAELESYLTAHTHLTVESIIAYVKQTYGIDYSLSGMRQLLYRLGFVYKKAKALPGKANREAQQAYIEQLEALLQAKGTEDPHYYLDGVHPQHNTQLAYGWIKKGEDKFIPSNTGRSRMNINGALNADTQEVVMRQDTTLNAQSTLALFKQLEEKHPKASVIYITLDNARYYKCKLVNEYLENSKIKLLFLPPYSPNLNVIERLWLFMRKQILYNQYYEKYADFEQAVMGFFENIAEHKAKLTTLLTRNFQLFPAA